MKAVKKRKLLRLLQNSQSQSTNGASSEVVPAERVVATDTSDNQLPHSTTENSRVDSTSSTSIFASYATASKNKSQRQREEVPSEEMLVQTFIQSINRCVSFDELRKEPYFKVMWPLLEEIFSVPCTSAPVERVFSHGGIIMRPHRARLSDKTLSQLMMARCNSHLK